MRKILAAAAALALVAPAAAHNPVIASDVEGSVLRALPAPEVIEDATFAVDRVLGAVLDIPIGPLVEAIDPHGRGYYRRGDTVRDMAGRDDPYFEDRMRHSLYAMGGQMNHLMDALAVLTPVLARSIGDIERSIEEATRSIPPRGRPYDERYRR